MITTVARAACVITALLACCASVVGALPAELGSESSWTLFWSDEFEGTALNTSAWTCKTGTHTSQELEYYLPKQVSVSGGNLVLTSDKQQYQNYNFVSGWVDTQNKFSTTFGRWEIRAQLPYGQGMWPAHWLMPESNICWPMGGEIDIMENLGNDMHRVHGALHWSHTQCGDAGEQNAGTWSPSFPYSFGTDFHVFGIVWNSTELSYYVDDTVYVHVESPGKDFAQKPFYWILNTAVGGWAGPPDSSTVWPQKHLIDYVRVYKPSM